MASKRRFVALFVLTILATAASARSKPSSVVDQYFEAYRAGDLERVLAVYAADGVFTDVNQRHEYQGATQLTEMFERIFALHRSIGLREQRRVVSGDTVVVQLTYTGELSGEALSQALGKEGCSDLEYEIPNTAWFTVRDGKIVRQDDFIDLRSLQEVRETALAASTTPATEN